MHAHVHQQHHGSIQTDITARTHTHLQHCPGTETRPDHISNGLRRRMRWYQHHQPCEQPFKRHLLTAIGTTTHKRALLPPGCSPTAPSVPCLALCWHLPGAAEMRGYRKSFQHWICKHFIDSHHSMSLPNSLSTSTGAGSIPRFILGLLNSQDTVRLQIRTFTNAPRG